MRIIPALVLSALLSTASGAAFAQSIALSNASFRPVAGDRNRDPIGIEEVNMPEMVARAMDPRSPLLVTSDVLIETDRVLSMLKTMPSHGSDYRRITTIDQVLSAAGCQPQAAVTVVLENSSSATLAYECSEGLIVAREARFESSRRSPGVAPGGEPFEIRPGTMASGQYLITGNGRRKSTVSWWEGQVILNVSLYHAEAGQAESVRQIAAQARTVD